MPGRHTAVSDALVPRIHPCCVWLGEAVGAIGANFQPLIEYAILPVSVSSTITFFASRCVSARKKTSATAKGKRGNASAPKARPALEGWLSIYPNIQDGGIDRLLRVEESETGIFGSESGSETDSESVKREAKKSTTYDLRLDPEARGANVSGSITLSAKEKD